MQIPFSVKREISKGQWHTAPSLYPTPFKNTKLVSVLQLKYDVHLTNTSRFVPLPQDRNYLRAWSQQGTLISFCNGFHFVWKNWYGKVNKTFWIEIVMKKTKIESKKNHDYWECMMFLCVVNQCLVLLIKIHDVEPLIPASFE